MKRALFLLFSSMAVVIAVVLGLFVTLRMAGHMTAHNVPTDAMSPLLRKGDQILCEGFSMMSAPPGRGDVVTFTTEGVAGILPEGGAPVIFMKRVVGLPGDTLQLVNGTLRINNQPASDYFDCTDIHYVLPHQELNRHGVDVSHPYIVPKDHVVVFGDNSANSLDSRYWGALPMKNLRHTYWFHLKHAAKPKPGEKAG